MTEALKRNRERAVVTVSGEVRALMDAYREQHPLSPSRAKVAEAAIAQYLERQATAGEFVPPTTTGAIDGR